VALGYVGDETVVSVLASGAGGLSALHPFCKDGEVVYFVVGYETEEENYSKLVKYVCVLEQ
jgi:hypothetical protein